LIIFFFEKENSQIKKALIINDKSLYLGKFYCWRLEIMGQGSGEWKNSVESRNNQRRG